MPESHFRLIRVRMFWITTSLSVAIIFCFLLAAWSLKVSHTSNVHQRNIICNAQNNSNKAIRRVLLLAASISAERKDATPDERANSANFYRRALALVGQVPCKN